MAYEVRNESISLSEPNIIYIDPVWSFRKKKRVRLKNRQELRRMHSYRKAAQMLGEAMRSAENYV
jgi:hypothetical protein